MTIATDPTKEYLPMPIEPLGEEWAKVNYPDVAKGYLVSIYGTVRSPLGKILKPNLQGEQLWVAIRKADGKTGSARLDRLVLSAFVGLEPHKTPEHIDGDSQNCQLINLKWRESSELEKRALKARRSRRDNAVKAQAKKPPGRPKAKEAPRGVQMLRIYALDDVRVTVSVEGSLQSIEPNPNKGFTPAQTMSLAEIMLRVAEMNALMGVKSVAK